MELLLLASLTFVAALVGTLTGFGTSTLMVPTLVIFFPVPAVLLFVGVLHWFGDIWKMLLFRTIRWKLVLMFGLPAIVMSFVGASLVLSIPQGLLIRILGGFLVVYALGVLVFRMQVSMKPGVLSALLGGGASGFFTGLFGFGGELRTVFLALHRLPKEGYLATIGAIAFLTDSTRLLTYWWDGIRLPPDLLQHLIILIPVTFLGAWVAKRFLSRLPERGFQIVMLVALLLIGIKLIIAP